MSITQTTLQFIEDHLNDDIISLSLLAPKFPEVDMQLAIRQIQGKQKTKEKIPCFYTCETLLYPAKLSLEQSSSEITAKHKSTRCEGSIMVDLTGGFGVDCYFFSKCFEKLIYVEREKELCELAKHNFKALGRENIKVINDTAEHFLENTAKVDWIYLDPARRDKAGKKLVLLSDCAPNVAELHDLLLSKAKNVMIKLSPMIDIAHLLRELPKISEIQVVAVENECKEVVAVLKSQTESTVLVRTTNYTNLGKVEQFDFELNDEQTAHASYTNQVQTYLYEPNAAIMKSGAFKLVSSKYKLDKLHINSHLYTSNELISDFPGKNFVVEKAYDFSKESLKSLQKEIHKVNLSIRNFPMSVNDLRKKLKLQEGGEKQLFATTLSDNKKILLLCTKTKS